MGLAIFSGSGNHSLSERVAAELGVRLGRRDVDRFPDGELHVEMHDSVRGCDVYLLQSTSPPVDEHLMELLFMADACRRAGAARLTAVIPYYGYARQDRRASGREPVGARLTADLLRAGGLNRVIALDLHSTALEGLFTIPLEHLTAVPQLVEAVEPHLPGNSVVVAPDLGAAKLAERFSKRLQLPVAIIHKLRVSGSDVSAHTITGDVRDLAPVIVDDMVTTAGTMTAAAQALVEHGAVPEITIVASHALLVGPAAERLQSAPVRRFVTTDSTGVDLTSSLPTQVVSLAPILAEAIQRLHSDKSMSDLLVHR
ncbi:MAG: ribose-phosphate pyrophosphokinase [Chloroflexi bacterium]|nr:ribose-phosphate pyrophosphokinase [Chloroflexota bacterium]